MLSPLVKDIDLFLNDKPSIYALRKKAKDALLKSGFPSSKTEKWKYTDVQQIIQTDYQIDTTNQSCSHHCCDHFPTQDFIEIHFCNGKIHLEEINTPPGLNIIPLPVVLYENVYKNYIFNSFDLEKHPFAALNGIYLEQGLCIHAEKDFHSNTPILIKYKFDNCDNQQLNIHNLFILEKNAQLDIIEDYSTTNTANFTNTVNEIYLKASAHLEHYKKLSKNPNGKHIALNSAKVHEKAFYKQFYFSEGTQISRQETIVNLEQKDARTEIYSAYKAKKQTLTDITTNINHIVAQTYSTQYAKAVLEDDSSATFQGKIYIAPNAIKTSGTQLHKALYLGKTATLNCKPELEIYADDVKCSHGASSGELDKEQLFYLQSRGIDKKEALKILTTAHLEELFSLISNPKIKNLFSK